MKTNMKTAAAPVKKGFTLMVAQPFVYILNSKFQGKHCDSCLKSGKVFKCTGCQFVHYCGKTCQAKGWKEHKEECSGMRRIKPRTLPDASRMMAKLIMKLKGGGDQETGQITSTWSRRFKDLMSHYSDIKQDKTRIEHFETLRQILIQFFGGEDSLPNTAEMLGIYGRMTPNCSKITFLNRTSFQYSMRKNTHNLGFNALMLSSGFRPVMLSIAADISSPDDEKKSLFEMSADVENITWWEAQQELTSVICQLCVNCFNILDGEMSCIGAGIYLAPSIIDHSCKPSAVVTFDGPTLYVRSLIDFPSLDWKKVFISYVDLLSVREDRRAELQKGYYFLCDCERCTAAEKSGTNGYHMNDLEMLASTSSCPSHKCQDPIFMSEKFAGITPSCKRCGQNLNEEMIASYKEVSEFTLEQIKAMGSTAYLDVCKVLLRKQDSALFHSLNILHVKTLDLAFDSAIQMQCWEDVLTYGQQLLPGFRHYLGGSHPLVGILCLKIAKVALLVGSPETETRALVKEAANVLFVTHGPHHPLIKDELRPLMYEISNFL